MQLAHESNYMVNSLARSLRLSDTRSIGIVVTDISNNFFSSVIKGAQEACHNHGYMLMVCNSDENERYEEEALKTLLENGLITYEEHQKAVSKLREKTNCKLIVTSANF